MYLEALHNGLIILDQGVELLSVDNLPKLVIVSCCKNMFSYEIWHPVVYTLTCKAFKVLFTVTLTLKSCPGKFHYSLFIIANVENVTH